MSFLKEFKEFAIKGNAADLAIGIVLGAAFGRIVDSVVNDLLMPILSKLIMLEGMNFSESFVALDGKSYATYAQAKATGVSVLAYGNFIQTILNFLFVAFALFLLVKVMNRLRRNEQSVSGPTPTEKLLTEIRDLLRK